MAGEHVFDSWEDFEESGELDRQLNHFTSGSSSSDRKSNSSPRLMKEDSHRTAYQPQLRILKRPSSSSATTTASAGDKPVQPRNIKTLEEREAAYAEARLRILGPDATSTSDQTKQSTKISSQGGQKVSGSDSNVSGLEASMGRLRTQSGGVLRQPKGPDGSSGFRQHDSSEPT